MKIPDILLIRIALLVAGVGLVLLFFFYTSYEAELVQASMLDSYEKGEVLRFQGTISSLRSSDSFTKISLDAVCSLDAVYFDKLPLSTGDVIAGVAEMDEYQGKKQLIIRELTVTRQ